MCVHAGACMSSFNTTDAEHCHYLKQELHSFPVSTTLTMHAWPSYVQLCTHADRQGYADPHSHWLVYDINVIAQMGRSSCTSLPCQPYLLLVRLSSIRAQCVDV